ncbi:MerR family transcriptional regulator [Miniimonas arenae]|uniref:MerR family transcriptional regulator n=1 Tax=Miniimonas arenae TaxID=676201 RepID=A0A5C5BBM8_9MICO|nr:MULTISPECIES: MerR family transcriptional regulator [Miniimonas]TNU73385.1 MerR family transcriptional regulator [Miniimonas arenae]
MWTIQEVARATGVSSRTLRHYDAIGLLPATETGPGGIRRYDDAALVRLQRILLLRDLGLGLAAIGDALADPGDGTSRAARAGADAREAAHLRAHLELLELERDALDRRIAAVRRTITARKDGTAMTKDMFDGFDHAQYEEEVTRRWGRDAYERSAAWWSAKTPQEQRDVQALAAELNAAWVEAARQGEAPDGELAQELAARHVRWLRSVPGTPAATGDEAQLAAYVRGLTELYTGDERFRGNWTGDPLQAVPHGPELVRDALLEWVDRNLAQ